MPGLSVPSVAVRRNLRCGIAGLLSRMAKDLGKGSEILRWAQKVVVGFGTGKYNLGFVSILRRLVSKPPHGDGGVNRLTLPARGRVLIWSRWS